MMLKIEIIYFDMRLNNMSLFFSPSSFFVLADKVPSISIHVIERAKSPWKWFLTISLRRYRRLKYLKATLFSAWNTHLGAHLIHCHITEDDNDGTQLMSAK